MSSRPIWWAVRAYVVVLVLAAAFAAPVTKVGGIPRFGSAEGGAALLGVALLASVALGLAGRRRRLPARSLRITVDVALMGCALFLLFYEVDRRVLTGYSYDPAPIEAPAPLTLSYDGTEINNVFVYDADGKLLQDVRLYDDFGRPLDIRYGDPDPTRRVLTDVSGATAFNTFPIRFYEPGTRRVANPDAAPSSLARRSSVPERLHRLDPVVGVQRRHLVGLRERRVVEDRGDEEVQPARVHGHDGLADVDEVRRARPEHMDAEHAAVLDGDEQLQDALAIA